MPHTGLRWVPPIAVHVDFRWAPAVRPASTAGAAWDWSEKWVFQEQQSPGLGAHPVPQVRLCAVVECSQQMLDGSRLAGVNPAGGAHPEALDPGLGALGADLASALWEKLPPCAHPQTRERRA